MKSKKICFSKNLQRNFIFWENQKFHIFLIFKKTTTKFSIFQKIDFLKDFLCKLFFVSKNIFFVSKKTDTFFLPQPPSEKLNFSKCNYFQRDSFGRLVGDPEISSNPQFFREILYITRDIVFFLGICLTCEVRALILCTNLVSGLIGQNSGDFWVQNLNSFTWQGVADRGWRGAGDSRKSTLQRRSRACGRLGSLQTT